MKEKIERYKKLISLSRRQREELFDKSFKKNKEYYRGNQWGGELGTQYTDLTVDNIIYANISTIIPSISISNPKIFVIPTKKPYPGEGGVMFDTVGAAAIKEVMLNYYYRKLRIKRQVRKVQYDALLGGFGVIEIGYITKTEKFRDDQVKEVHELLKADMPFARRISPNDFLKDPESRDHLLEDAEWVAYRWVKRLEDLKSDDKYKNTKTLKTNFTVKTDYASKSDKQEYGNGEREDFERVEGWTIWDKREKTLVDVVEEHDKLLRERDWPLDFGDGFNCEILYFNENPDEPFPLSDVDIYIDQQDELNILQSLQVSHAKKVSQRKYIAKESAFDETELDKIERGPDGTVAVSKIDPASAITTLKDAAVSQDLYLAIQAVKNNTRQLSGVAEFEQGGAQKFDTATEPSLIQRGITVRRQDRRDIIEEFVVRIVSKLDKVIQQTFSDDEQIPLQRGDIEMLKARAPQKLSPAVPKPEILSKIVGPQEIMPFLPWLSISKADIQGDFDFEIEAGSMQPVNDETRKRDMIALRQIMEGNPYIDPLKATRMVLETFRVKTDILKPEQQVKQEQAQAKQMAVQSELAMDAPKRQTDIQKTQMKEQGKLQVQQMKNEGALISELAKK
ncbi:MAG: hypothetical protein OEV28_13545 [Nitrospirota bacterium]|nr:hypothetical protein [Nitrospirota bacterium]